MFAYLTTRRDKIAPADMGNESGPYVEGSHDAGTDAAFFAFKSSTALLHRNPNSLSPFNFRNTGSKYLPKNGCAADSPPLSRKI